MTNSFRRKLSVSLIFCLLTMKTFATDIKICWDAGNISIGEIINQDMNGLYGSIRILNVHFIDKDSGFGVSVTPFVWNSFPDKNGEYTNEHCTFCNADIYYDFFHYRRAFSLEPIFSLNCIDINDIWQYQIDLGLKFGLYHTPIFLRHMRAEYFTAKIGAKVINSNPYAYVDFGVNILGIILAIGHSKYNDVEKTSER